MATLKRFTETEKWSDDWFANLSTEHKLFWIYLCDNCDQAGVWNDSRKITKALLGIDNFDFDAALVAYADRVQVLGNGAWWIVKFIAFQNPKGISHTNNYHAPIFKSAAKYGLPIEDLTKTSPTLAENTSRVQGKDKDIDKANAFELFWAAYPKKKAKMDAQKAWSQNSPPIEEVLKALAWQKRSEDWTKDNGKFIKLPAGYIRDRRWEDEPPYQAAPKERVVPKTMGDHFKLPF